MRSSTGKHFPALDHVRALAAFMVFSWHFLHSTNGYPVSFSAAVPPLFSIFQEGHTGVALFMVLSGYLFATILANNRIHYGYFLLNRFLRLMPLLIVVMSIIGIKHCLEGGDILAYGNTLIRGFILPIWPNGGWSIAVEIQFYLILPFLLRLQHISRLALPLVVLLMIIVRMGIWWEVGEVQTLSYWTLVGRIDQFVLGIVAARERLLIGKNPWAVPAGICIFLFLTDYFRELGGFYNIPSYTSPHPLWIILPTIEGLAYGSFIAWYDCRLMQLAENRFSQIIARIGSWSYSMYLLHFFWVFVLADFVNTQLMDISDFCLALPCALICFLLLTPVACLSFHFIEMPFLKFRKKYLLN